MAGEPRVELNAHMLFGDVLAERFSPATDPNRLHSLGVLMNGCVEKGQVSDPGDEVRDLVGGYGALVVYRYSPPWAPGVEATAISRLHGQYRQLQYAAGLRLHREDGGVAGLDIGYDPLEGLLRINNQPPEELVQGETAPLRIRVANLAIQFFQDVASRQG